MFYGDLDVEMTCTVRDIERTDDQRPVRCRDGCSFHQRLPDHRIRRAYSGPFFSDAGSLDLRSQAQAATHFGQGDIEVHPYVEVRDLEGGWIFALSYDHWYSAALFHLCSLAWHRHHGVALLSDPSSAIHINQGVGETVGMLWAVEIVNDLSRKFDLLGGSIQDDCLLRGNQDHRRHWMEHVA